MAYETERDIPFKRDRGTQETYATQLYVNKVFHSWGVVTEAIFPTSYQGS